MKSKDLGLIAIIAIFAGVFALLLSNFFLASPNNLQQEVEVVQPISTDFKEPDKRYFNEQAVNPTQLIRINENQNQNPFQ